jgi:type VI secretion system secreted protein VgrG
LVSGGTLTLSGNGVYIFQVTSSLTTVVGSNVVLVGVDPCNVFWQVASLATLDGAAFPGNVVAQTGVHLGPGASLTGRALAAAAGDVTMAGSNFVGGCSALGTGLAATDIPTLSEWALILLGTVLALSGLAAVRRVRRMPQ